MTMRMLIDARHPEETRVVVVRGQKVEEFDFESASRKQLRGNIYLAKVIRERFKMRRKIKALASEGRASALILSSLPVAIFLIVQVVSPDFYGSVWKFDLTKIVLACAGAWMATGNYVMYRMVNFRI